MITTGLILGEIVALKLLERALDKENLSASLAKASLYETNKGKNSKKTWTITNLDDPLALPIIGKYGAESYEENISSNYVSHNALGRFNPILQFVNGNNDTLNFTAVLYAKDLVDLKLNVKTAIQNLKKWSKPDKKLKRPPIVSVKVADGDGSVFYPKAVIKSCTPTHLMHDVKGNLIHANIALSLEEYVPYTQTTQSFDTRYHDVMDGEYHELLAAREYKNPMLGVVVRNYNEQSQLATGDVVKLPDKQSENISPSLIKPKSLVLNGLTDNSYYKFLNNKTDETPPHIKEILNEKLDLRKKQYGYVNL